jgi:pilus assembly protein Flp/PilA
VVDCRNFAFDFFFTLHESPKKQRTRQARQDRNPPTRRAEMGDLLLRFYVRFEILRSCDEAQDLVEYALLMTLISLALVSGINGIAKAVNATFSNISGSLA